MKVTKNTQTKHLFFPFLAIILLCGCTASEKDALEKEITYSQKVKGNYAQLGICLLELLKISQHEGRVSYDIYTAQGIRIPHSELTKIYGKEDTKNKIYYIFHTVYAGIHQHRFWAVTLQNLNKDATEALFQLKGSTLWGTPMISEDTLQSHIAECAFIED